MPVLDPGARSRSSTITTADGQALTLPNAFAGEFAVVLFYRGRGARTATRNYGLPARQRGAGGGGRPRRRPVGGQRGDHDAAGREARPRFPCRLRRRRAAVAALTGAFVNPDPAFLQSTGFVLDPAGNVVVSVYSSGAIGRLVPDDVIGLVRYLREHTPAATA